ncbi:MAG TPA: DUF1592 domain-containing protein, partial [Bdellovibrionales bacterium]|nr:DUF1592 domain-containing protein [Bdellovibrionales bacterium]
KSALSFHEGPGNGGSGARSLCVDSDVPGSATPIRRLSKRELLNSLRDIFGPAIFASVTDELNLIPAEEKGTKFDHVSNTLDYAHVEALFTLAERLADQIAASFPGYLGVGTCWTSPTEAECIKSFVARLGLKLYRRPLSEAELTKHLAVYELLKSDSKKEATAALIAGLLQSPHFYYIVEISGTPTSDQKILELTPYELATRLSFALTGSAPDDELLASAANGGLISEAALLAQVNRLLSSTAGRQHLTEYASQYLGLDMLPGFNYSVTFLDGHSTAGLANAAVYEAQAYMLHHMLDQKKTFGELMTSRVSFVKGAALAAVYKIAPPTSFSGETILPEERGGLLTRAAMLVSGEDETGPFRRGRKVASEFMCRPLGRPDPNEVPEAFDTPTSPDTLSTRAYLENLTAPKTCMACHATLNSFGFAFENFDGLGRYRTAELRIKDDKVINSFPIDAHVSPFIDGKVVNLSSPVALSRALAESEDAQQCFSRKWYRFAFGKMEKLAPNGDACAIERLTAPLNDEERGIAGMLSETFKLKDFRLRIQPTN